VFGSALSAPQLLSSTGAGRAGGLTIGHRAYVISQDGAATVEGRRRLFLNWGYIWRTKRRTEQEQQYFTIDPHSPPEFRANIVRNLDEFHEVFGTAEATGCGWIRRSGSGSGEAQAVGVTTAYARVELGRASSSPTVISTAPVATIPISSPSQTGSVSPTIAIAIPSITM